MGTTAASLLSRGRLNIMTEAKPYPKEDSEALLSVMMPFAERMLLAHREFFPFGAEMSTNGQIALASATDGSERPQSQFVIDMLRAGYRKKAIAGEIRACATLYDSMVTLPESDIKQDAIAALIDHRDGYSATVFFPYKINGDSTLSTRSPFAISREPDIFKNQSGG